MRYCISNVEERIDRTRRRRRQRRRVARDNMRVSCSCLNRTRNSQILTTGARRWREIFFPPPSTPPLSVKYNVTNFRRRPISHDFYRARIYRTTSTAYFGKYKKPARATLKEHAPLVRQRSRSTIMASFPFLIVPTTFKILGHYCAERMVPFSGEVRSYIYIFRQEISPSH